MTDKLSKDELLECFKEMWESATIGETWELNKEAQQAYQQIVAILKASSNLKNKSLMKLAQDLGVSFSVVKVISDHAQPEVTEEFIEKWADEFDALAQESLIIDIDLIRQMFQEAGYLIGAKVTEEWLEEKARELLPSIGYKVHGEYLKSHIEVVKDFIRKLYEDMPARKVSVGESLNLKHIDKLLKHFTGQTDDLGREYVISWLKGAGMEVVR